jgi:hypothetical protein
MSGLVTDGRDASRWSFHLATRNGRSSQFMAGLIRSPAMDIAELQENGRAFAERAERNPWIQVWRIVKAEAERTGDDKLIEMYVRLFKAYEASCYPQASRYPQ